MSKFAAWYLQVHQVTYRHISGAQQCRHFSGDFASHPPTHKTVRHTEACPQPPDHACNDLLQSVALGRLVRFCRSGPFCTRDWADLPTDHSANPPLFTRGGGAPLDQGALRIHPYGHTGILGSPLVQALWARGVFLCAPPPLHYALWARAWIRTKLEVGWWLRGFHQASSTVLVQRARHRNVAPWQPWLGVLAAP